MKKRIAVLFAGLAVAAGFAGFLPSHAAAKTRVPAACVTKTAGLLHIQVGYCP